MTKPTRDELKQRLTEARRHHHNQRYPGDLAAAIGLRGGEATTTPKARGPLWLRRWAPALAAAAVLLAAGVAWQVLIRPSTTAPNDNPPVANNTPDDGQATPIHAGGDNAPTPDPRSAAVMARAVSPEAWDLATRKVDAATAEATKAAEHTLAQQWAGRSTPSLPDFSGLHTAAALGQAPAPGFSLTALPHGLRWSVPTLTTLRKELS